MHGEVEAVCQWGAHIVVIDEVEAVGKQHLFHELGASAILLHIVKEVIASFAGSLHECCHGVLNAVGSAAGECVHKTVAEEVSELAHAEVLLHWLIHTVIQLVADAGHAYTLSGIGEGL